MRPKTLWSSPANAVPVDGRASRAAEAQQRFADRDVRCPSHRARRRGVRLTLVPWTLSVEACYTGQRRRRSAAGPLVSLGGDL